MVTCHFEGSFKGDIRPYKGYINRLYFGSIWVSFLSQQENFKFFRLICLVLMKEFEPFIPWWLENRGNMSYLERQVAQSHHTLK